MRQSSGRPGSPDSPLDILNEGTADLIYRPSELQRKAKIRFWAKMDSNPLQDRDSVTLEAVKRMTGSGTIEKWWKEPGFKDWFLNSEEHKQRLEYLYDLALGAAEDILLNTDPKAQGARVQMIKAVAELGAKFPRQQVGGMPASPITQAIQGMDRASLKVLLEKNGVQMSVTADKGPEVLDVTADSDQ